MIPQPLSQRVIIKFFSMIFVKFIYIGLLRTVFSCNVHITIPIGTELKPLPTYSKVWIEGGSLSELSFVFP